MKNPITFHTEKKLLKNPKGVNSTVDLTGDLALPKALLSVY